MSPPPPSTPSTPSPPTQVPRPSKEAHEKAIDFLNTGIASLESKRNGITAQIEQLANKQKGSVLGAARSKFDSLKNQKRQVMNERKEIFNKQDQIKAVTDGLIKSAKDAKSTIKFSSIEQVEKAIRELRRKQETCTMSLTDEKKLIKEIEQLSASKKIVAQLSGKEDDIQASKTASGDMRGMIAEKNKALDELSKQMDAQKAVLDALNAKESVNKNQIPDLIKSRDEVRSSINEKKDEIKKLRNAFKKDNNDWFKYQKQETKRRDAQKAEEEKARETEKLAYLKAKEEEEVSERALMKTSILAMNQHPRNG